MGLGYCNITKCCTEVCPEEIHITDNAIIPLKERVVDAHYDPIAWLGRKIGRRPAPLPAAQAGEYTGAAHTQPAAAPAPGPGDRAPDRSESGTGG
jgi:succinate dehydrogenase / fumarate reductase iron-sulfur subunit